MMMIPRPLRSLVGLALLLQVVAAFGATRGLVLCVGAAGHVAVEDSEAATRCRASVSVLATDATRGGLALGSPQACVDTPLLGVASERSASPVRVAAVQPAMVPVAELPRPDALMSRAIWTREPPPKSARILRSVVLLI